MRYLSFVFLGLVWLLSACNSISDNEPRKERVKKFYDLEAFFNAEINRLDSLGIQLSKQLRLNDKRESAVQENVDYEKELKVFVEADINKPAWWDKYEGDTTFYQQDKIQQIKYESSDKELKTQLIIISFAQNQQIDSVQVFNRLESTMMNLTQKMVYNTDNGYKIYATEKLLVSSENEVDISASFVR